MTNKYFTKEDLKGYSYFLIQNVDQLEGYNLTDLMYATNVVYDPNKDLIVLMFGVSNDKLEGDLYLTFPRSLLRDIKRMPNDEAFFNGNIGFGFIPNSINQ